MKRITFWLVVVWGVWAVCQSVPAARAEATRVRIAKQAGLTYLPYVIVMHNGLIEKHAKAAGLDVAVEWKTFSGGNVMNDALLSGNLDYAATGIPPFLILWDKARGPHELRAVCGYGSVPLLLVTRNPSVKTLRDFGPQDRIAVPAVRASLQAIVLQIAAEKAFGPGQHGKLDAITISRGHPDAATALISGKGEINSHFSAPPYQYQELAAPGVHAVMAASDVFDGPISNGLLYTTQKFHDENPKLFAAVMASLKEAIELINRDRTAAAGIYLQATGEKTTVEGILKLLNEPGVEWTMAPRNAFTIAQFMKRIGSISRSPASWKDLFFPEVHALPGS